MKKKPNKADIPMPNYGRKAEGPITVAVRHLARICGAGTSEAASELFVEELHTCVCDTLDDIDKSHAEGLCLDASGILGDRLEEFVRTTNPISERIEEWLRGERVTVAKPRERGQ